MTDEQWGPGHPTKWSDHGTVVVGNRTLPLIYGEHPHSRRDNRHYVQFGDGEPTGFDGHRVCMSVSLVEYNYLKSSGLSGDEVRMGGTGRIFADGEQVYEFFFREIEHALLCARHLIAQLRDSSSRWLIKKDREALPGRLIYFRDEPAIIDRLDVERGRVAIVPDGIPEFRRPAWHEQGDGPRVRVVDDVLSDSIWWFRERPTPCQSE